MSDRLIELKARVYDINVAIQVLMAEMRAIDAEIAKLTAEKG